MRRRSTGQDALRPARMGLVDLVRVGLVGMRSRPTRVVLSALGIAIGIAAVVAVVGISESSRADLEARLDQLGTNLLRVSPSADLTGETVPLPDTAPDMIAAIPPVQSVTTVEGVDAHVYRNEHIPSGRTGSIEVLSAGSDLPGNLGVEMSAGTWLQGDGELPTVVLGGQAADRLGVGADAVGELVWLADEWFTVVGIMEPVLLAPELDASAIVGPATLERLQGDSQAATLYVRAQPDSVEEVRSVLGATANPERPSDVSVSRPSDALTAQEAVDEALRTMLLGLGAVSLLVGGVGVANTMVISVLERRSEIGLRRALGATRGDIRLQFVLEALLLSLLGGVGGAALGAGVTAVYALAQGWSVAIPLWGIGAALGTAVFIGVAAGLYPAVRASRLSPTEALTGM